MTNPWIARFARKTKANATLVCVPYAGGGAAVFRNWAKWAPPGFDVVALQLPGREMRYSERTYDRISPLVAEASQAILDVVSRPFDLFGYSMGALVAFEIARIIEQTDPNALGHLFVAARVSPDTPATGNRPELLNDAEFIAHLMSYQNEGEQIAMDPELLGLCLPTIRADFEIVGTYAFKPSQPLRCPIIAFGGSDDHGTPTQALIEWRKHTTGPFLTKIYRGGHFFLKNNGQRIIADIASARDQLREESLAGRMSATRALPASFGVTG